MLVPNRNKKHGKTGFSIAIDRKTDDAQTPNYCIESPWTILSRFGNKEFLLLGKKRVEFRTID